MISAARLSLPLVALGLLATLPARADDELPQPATAPPASAPAVIAPAEPEVPEDLDRLVLDTGRRPIPKPDHDTVRIIMPGEYQLRFQAQRSIPLDVSTSMARLHPGAISDSTGQSWFGSHWLRLTPRMQLRENFEIIGQLDLVTGLLFGEIAHDTSADETPRDEYDAFKNVQPRWLYANVMTPIGLFRVGQQPSHWGMGLVANDGDHAPLFGDYRYGDISERLLFATKPLGKDSPFAIAIAGDLVFRDQLAVLSRGDQAVQGVLAALYEKGTNQLGLYGVWRHQVRDRSSGDPVFAYEDELNLGVVDAAARVAAPVPGNPNTFLIGAGEAAMALGNTNMLRTPAQAAAGESTTIRSWGGAGELGVVHRAFSKPAVGREKSKDPQDFGDLVVRFELGYASGDADPYDGVEHRFSFNANHRVGLVMFDEVLRWQTARAATAAQDPKLTNATRPPPGVELLPSNGGVFGAEYVNPTVLVRPKRWLDLKGGVVVAQTTSDNVDPYRVATQGAYVNYRGGDPKKHDLGVELDLGTEARASLDYGLTLVLGAQGGVLFPGGALADAAGGAMKTPWVAVGRLGLLF